MNRIALLLIVTAALVTAGCIGGGGDADTGSASDPDTTDDGAAGPGQSGTDDGTGNATDEAEPQPSWENETRQGSVNGASAGPLSVFSSGEEFEVANGTLNLTLAISSSDGELSVNVYPPCEDEGVAGTGFLADCESYGFSTEDGEGQWGIDDPKAGTWDAFIFRTNDGAGEVPYELTIAQLMPSES